MARASQEPFAGRDPRAGNERAPGDHPGSFDEAGDHDHPHDHDSGEMRAVDEVRATVLERIRTLSPIELHLQEAYGCVLASGVTAELDIPPFTSSAMDGFAVRASDVAGAMLDEPVELRVAGRAPVGQPSEATVGGGEAVRIATGAPVPAGADCIVPIEHCVVQGDVVHVLKSLPEGANVRPAGQDVRAGQ